MGLTELLSDTPSQESPKCSLPSFCRWSVPLGSEIPRDAKTCTAHPCKPHGPKETPTLAAQPSLTWAHLPLLPFGPLTPGFPGAPMPIPGEPFSPLGPGRPAGPGTPVILGPRRRCREMWGQKSVG